VQSIDSENSEEFGVQGLQVRPKLHEISRGSPPILLISLGENDMKDLLLKLLGQDEGQDIAEYAVMLAVILVIVVGTIRLIGTNANTVFSSVASSIQ
jgi:Flp pilus assembly pilin Flp